MKRIKEDSEKQRKMIEKTLKSVQSQYSTSAYDPYTLPDLDVYV